MTSIFIYFFMVLLIFLFTYILGGVASMMLLYILLFAPLISLLLTLFARKQLIIKVSISSSEVEKNGIITTVVTMENKSFLPIVFIDTLFIEAANFKLSDAPIIRCSLGIYKKMILSVEYKAQQRGVVKLGVKDIVIRDYLGLFRFSMLKHVDKRSLYKEVTILPEIFKISERCSVLKNYNSTENSIGMEECAVSLVSSIGEPGYEFREYSPGDSLCRIHWKLSAKRDKLMVRKDQGSGIKQKLFVLDPCLETIIVKSNSDKTNILSMLTGRESFTTSKDETSMVEEKVLDALLSLANTVVKTQAEIRLFLFLEDNWTEIQLKDTRDISKLQFLLASYEFVSKKSTNLKERVPVKDMLENWNRAAFIGAGEVILFTGEIDKDLCSYINILKSYDMKVAAVSIKSSIGHYKAEDLNLDNLLSIKTNENFCDVFS